MSVHYESGDQRRPYLQCDADNCPNRLRAQGNVGLSTDLTPLPSTGWTKRDVDGERRDYCATHASDV